MQRAWVSGALVMVALTGIACCERAPTEAVAPRSAAPDGADRSMPTAEELRRLRAQARSAPEAALTALRVLELQRESLPPEAADALGQIRVLAELTRFNADVRALSTTDNLRESTRLVLELIARPKPENKHRLAEAVWGLIGKLEAQQSTDPAMVHSVTRRLVNDDALTRLLGQQMTTRLRAVEQAAQRLKVTTRVKTLLTSSDFGEVLEQVSRWKDRAQDTARARMAVRELVQSLEARLAGQSEADTALRTDAAALLDRPDLLALTEDAALTDRVQIVLEQSGAARLSEWLAEIESSTRRRPVHAAKLSCRAIGFARTPKERAAAEAGTRAVEERLDHGARRSAGAYLDAIARRDFKAWRAQERPFLDRDKRSPEVFAEERERWAVGLAELDPKRSELELLGSEIDLCQVRASFVVGRPKLSRRAATLVMCWHAERVGWYPCRTLTRWTTKDMIRP